MWKKIVIYLIAVVFLIGILAYSKRYAIIVWHLQSDKDSQEMVILEMLKRAKPMISRDLQLNILEKAYSWGTGNRNEKERQLDASDDVRTFVESAFKSQTLRFKDVHNLTSVNNFPLGGAEIALDWNSGNKEEVLVAFSISLLKRKIDSMQINENSSFFKELKSYVETKARKN